MSRYPLKRQLAFLVGILLMLPAAAAFLGRISSRTRFPLPSCLPLVSSSSSFSNLDGSILQEEEDTIFALSSGSPSGQATAVAVIRLTGPRAGDLLQKLTNNKPLPPPRVAALRKLFDPSSKLPLDQALVLYFPAPTSFTGENVVELHCHGSRAVVQDMFATLQQLGARLAEPGEFTQRAWLAGKLDVLQIEALADLLTADTNRQRTQALQQLDGKLSAVYDEWRSELIAGLAHAEAVVDFGDDEALGEDDDDDDAQWNVWGGVVDRMQRLRTSMQKQLQDSRRGELVREGVKISILGPPNAGKSSLFNILADRDAAIVSPTAGTTRDVLELSLNLGGVKCILQDTAGVRSQTDDLIELEGIKRAVRAAASADLVVAMVDSSDEKAGLEILREVLDQNKTLAEEGRVDPRQVLLVLNKSDLKRAETGHSFGESQIGGRFEISCVTQEGVDSFLDELTHMVVSRVSGSGEDSRQEADEGSLITRARHRQHVEAAAEALERFEMLSQQGTMAVDMAAEELRLAASELGRITGAVDVEDVLDRLFADFCIGK